MPLTRRDLLAAGALALPGFLSTARADGKKPVLRAAHITDVHITKDRDAPRGVAAMFAHLFGQKDWRPDAWDLFAANLYYVPGDASTPDGLKQLQEWFKKTPGQSGGGRGPLWRDSGFG